MEDSFSSFMHRHYRTFMSYCLARGQTHSSSDEIVDEAFVRLWRKWNERSSQSEALNKKWMYNAIEYIIKERLRTEKKASNLGYR